MKFSVKTQGFSDIIDITPQVRQFLGECSFDCGLVFIFVPGTTAALTTMEFEPNAAQDLKDFFEKLVPQDAPYKHNETWGDANGFSHIRGSLLKPNLYIPFEKGEMLLGQWQSIVLIDFDDRPREREIIIKFIETK